MTTGELIFLVWNDLVGVSRTRGVPVGEYDRRKDHGLGWALAGQAMTPFEDIAENPWGPMGEVRQIPDDATRQRIVLRPEHPPLQLVLCDSLNPDGSPWECCTRSFLAAALADLKAETGLDLHIAYENEFALFGEGLGWAAPFSLDAVRRIAPFADLCVAALIDAELGLETFEPEYGVGQFEVTNGPAPGLAGADRVVLTREVVREAARQCGLRATFAPKPAPDAVGNGCHLHLSFWDADGNAAAYDADAPGELSTVAASFCAGVQRHLGALCAMTAPSPISYLRLGPHHWSCGYDIVGVQNREAAIRICPSPAAEPAARGEAFNIEFRFTDATASPYLAIGVIVRAGLQGIRDELPRPRLVDGEPDDLSEDEREKLGINRLPTSLEQALDTFGEDETVKGWFTPTMVEAYTALKRHEVRLYGESRPQHMCERYMQVY
ncbi:MAG: glutamine synthetase family protein [Rhodospirillaceae bacterium]|nr:glutamine synthetase family protein [Rhodospirillaceae bacterium]